jgi:hypothetical protein
MTINRATLMSQGTLAGCIGYATLAGFVSIIDLVGGRSPFHTAAVLGAALFYGVTDASQLQVTPAYVLAYNGAHLLVFLLLGLIGSALAAVADRGSQLWYVSVFFFIFVAFHAIGALQALSDGMRTALPESMIWVAGIAAALAMGAYLMRVHPQMRRPQRWDA